MSKQPLPIIATRGLVVLPKTDLAIEIGRQKSIQALELAIANKSQVIVVTQMNPDLDDPKSKDLSTVGTLAKIKKAKKNEDDNDYSIVVTGLKPVILQLPSGNEELPLTCDYKELEEKIKCLDKMTDEEIVMQIKEKHDDVALDYIIKKYRNLVRVKARAYFLIGADREDIIQEGMIGLYKGVRDFRSDKLSSFRAFAEMCITRQIITAVKTATRQKHIPLNSYVSLNKPIYDEESDRTLLDIISGSVVIDPEEMMIHREEFLDIEDKMEKLLSDLEWKVLIAYLDGKSYQEIAVELHKHVKSIDNALQRVKRKLEKYVDGHGNIDIKGSMSDFGSVGKYLRDMY